MLTAIDADLVLSGGLVGMVAGAADARDDHYRCNRTDNYYAATATPVVSWDGSEVIGVGGISEELRIPVVPYRAAST